MNKVQSKMFFFDENMNTIATGDCTVKFGYVKEGMAEVDFVEREECESRKVTKCLVQTIDKAYLMTAGKPVNPNFVERIFGAKPQTFHVNMSWDRVMVGDTINVSFIELPKEGR